MTGFETVVRSKIEIKVLEYDKIITKSQHLLFLVTHQYWYDTPSHPIFLQRISSNGINRGVYWLPAVKSNFEFLYQSEWLCFFHISYLLITHNTWILTIIYNLYFLAWGKIRPLWGTQLVCLNVSLFPLE